MRELVAGANHQRVLLRSALADAGIEAAPAFGQELDFTDRFEALTTEVVTQPSKRPPLPCLTGCYSVGRDEWRARRYGAHGCGVTNGRG